MTDTEQLMTGATNVEVGAPHRLSRSANRYELKSIVSTGTPLERWGTLTIHFVVGGYIVIDGVSLARSDADGTSQRPTPDLVILNKRRLIGYANRSLRNLERVRGKDTRTATTGRRPRGRPPISAGDWCDRADVIMDAVQEVKDDEYLSSVYAVIADKFNKSGKPEDAWSEDKVREYVRGVKDAGYLEGNLSDRDSVRYTAKYYKERGF